MKGVETLREINENEKEKKKNAGKVENANKHYL